MSSERNRLLKIAHETHLLDLAEKIIFGEYIPGVDDNVFMDRLKILIESSEEILKHPESMALK